MTRVAFIVKWQVATRDKRAAHHEDSVDLQTLSDEPASGRTGTAA